MEFKNTTKDVIKNAMKNKIVIAIFALIILCVIMMLIYMKRQQIINNPDISNAIHGIIMDEGVAFYRKPKESKWRLIKNTEVGENAYIIDETIDENGQDWYKVKIDKKVGYVKKESVKYFEFSSGDDRSLMSDVSKFNIMYKHFETAEDYETFILKSNINYAYIRLGGRGYGDKGNLYTDPNFDVFIKACEYLGVPYGFYYVDEAINSEEVQEEVEFIKDLISKNKTKMCTLPLVIDIETHDGMGRADELNADRVLIINKLIQKFKEENIETLIYSNAKYASDFLYTIDSKFWLAYYDLKDEIPQKWYTQIEQEAALNQELMNKLVAWQFTESGAGAQIPYTVDVSLVDNIFFRNFVKTSEE